MNRQQRTQAYERESQKLGAQIHSLRTSRGWTLATLSEQCHVSPAYLSQIERGIGSPRLELLVWIVAALGATIEICCQQTEVNG